MPLNASPLCALWYLQRTDDRWTLIGLALIGIDERNLICNPLRLRLIRNNIIKKENVERFMLFDSPLFKILPKNETSLAKGKQSGFVITEALRPYFPQLTVPMPGGPPTVEQKVTADLFIDGVFKESVETRYQYQTWSGTRLERRLTSNLMTIINAASPDDVLEIQRGINDPDHYRLELHRKGSAGHGEISARVGSRRGGVIDATSPPVKEVEVSAASAEQAMREAGIFQLFDAAAVYKETRSQQIARSRVFRNRLADLYSGRCALCGLGHMDRNKLSEIEASHIVPRHLKGADDARNGIAFCRSHHWAFDRGLFGIKPSGRAFVPKVRPPLWPTRI